MNKTKRLLCIVLAVVVMIGTLGIMTAFADNTESEKEGVTSANTEEKVELTGEAKNLFDFDTNLETNWISCTKMSELLDQDPTLSGSDFNNDNDQTATGLTKNFNDNKSLTMAKDNTQIGANLEIKVTDEMRENYLKATDKKFYVSFYLSDCRSTRNSEKDKFVDASVRVYTRFKTTYKVKDKDGNETDKNAYLKATTLNGSYNCYQQIKDKSFKFVDGDDKPLENLDNVESIIVSLYHYNYTTLDNNKVTQPITEAYKAELQMSAFAYEGKPLVNDFVAPTPEDSTENISFTDYQVNYLKGWADTPNKKGYFAEDGTYNSKSYKSSGKGWIYLKEVNPAASRQWNFYTDLDRDQYNKAIVTANQNGGSKKAKITVYCSNALDENGESMPVEFQVLFQKYDGSYIPVQEFIEPGVAKTFTFDVSELGVNDVNYIRVAFMAFWKYDPKTKLFYDTDTMKRYDKKGNLLEAVKNEENGDLIGYSADGGKTIVKTEDIAKYTAKCSNGKQNVDITEQVKNGTLIYRTINTFEAFTSPIYTVGSDEQIDSDQKVTTVATTTSGKEYKYAGYHFFDFKQEALNGYYGCWTHPSYINFLYEKNYLQNTIVDKNLAKDGQAQGFKDNNEKGVTITNSAEYNKLFEEAKSLPSGGYQVEIASPYPRIQCQHQSQFFLSGEKEDKERLQNNENHKPLKAQGETYNYTEQMKKGLQYAQNHTNPEKRGYLAIDVYVLSSIHGYKNTYNTTYQAWCKKNKKVCKNENARVQVQVNINAWNEELGSKATVTATKFVNVGEKSTLYLDVSELKYSEISSITLQPQSYENLANKEQGGDNGVIGITDLQVRFSAIYVPSSQDAGLTTTVDVTQKGDNKAKALIKKLYNELPGLDVDDYNSIDDYNKLYALIKAWSEAPLVTQAECEKELGIDYATLSMLEADVYEKIFGSDWDDSPITGDIAFPMLSLAVLGLSGYLIVRTRKGKEK